MIVDRKEDCYEALSINDIVYRLNLLDNLEQENQKLDEKVCCLTMDLITTKSYEQLEKECNRFKKENEQLRKQIDELIKGIQDSAKMSADAICKPMMKEQWGDVE